MRVRLARRFSWLRWMLTDGELAAEIKEFNRLERAWDRCPRYHDGAERPRLFAYRDVLVCPRHGPVRHWDGTPITGW